MSSVYVVFYSFPTAAKPSINYVGAWSTAADAIDFLNVCSSQNGNPYSALPIATIPVGTTATYSDFAPMEITVIHLPIHRQSKHLYVRAVLPPVASTTKIPRATETVTLRDCSVCGRHGPVVDEEGHCSHACATGTNIAKNTVQIPSPSHLINQRKHI